MEPNSVGPNSSSSNDENHLSKPSCSKETSCSRDGASKNPEAKKTKADFLFLNEIGMVFCPYFYFYFFFFFFILHRISKIFYLRFYRRWVFFHCLYC